MNGKFGSTISGKTLKKKLLLYSGIFAVSLGLCGVSFYGVLAPVGICFQGCFAGRRRMFFSFLGVIIGSCIFGFAPVKYIAVSLIVLVMNEAFLNLADIKKPVFACFGVTGAMGLIGLITLISPDNEMAGLLYIAELIICAMLTALFFGVVDGDGILDKKGGKGLTAILIAVLGLSVVPSFGDGFPISVGRILAVGLTALGACRGGIFGGVVVGLVGGLGLDLSGVNVPVWCYSMALGGVLCGAAHGRNRLFRLLLFFVAAGGARLLAFRDLQFFTGVIEIFIGCGAVAFLPKKLTDSAVGVFGEEESDICVRHAKVEIAEKLMGISEAYSAMAESLEENSSEDNKQIGLSVYEDACKALCGSCECKNSCWDTKSEETRNALEGALRALFVKGNLNTDDFGESFPCIYPDEFCLAATKSFREMRKARLESCQRIDEDRRVSRQYHTISEILDGSVNELIAEDKYDRESGAAVKSIISGYTANAETIVYRDKRGVLRVEISGNDLKSLQNDPFRISKALSQKLECVFDLPDQIDGKDYCCLSFKERPRYDISVGATAEKRSGEPVSGDCATYFRDKDGDLFVVLCDGMGSGEEAHNRAVETMRLCENFLRVGVPPVSAMEIVVASVEQQDRGAGGVTVDIAKIDPYMSKLQSVKYGAAPTYIRHRTADGRYSLSKICAGGSGGELYAIAEAETDIREGDIILMASDGAESGNVLEKSLMGVMTDDSSDLCDILMHMLPKDCSDDRTLIALNYFRKSDEVWEKSS